MSRTHRSPRGARRWTAPPDSDNREAALVAVEAARAVVQATRRRVRAGEAGAAERHAAEHRLHAALKRLDAVGWVPPSMPDRGTSRGAV